jgi:hypothetical protein
VGAQAATYNPTGIHALDPITRQAGGFADAFQHHSMGALHGAAQGAEHLTNYATGGNVAGIRNTMQADDAALNRRESDYQARTSDNSIGSYLGAAAGEIAPWMVGVGEARALGLLPKATGLLGKTASATAGGAIYGAAQPVTGDGSYANQKAAQIGVGAGTGGLLHVGGATVGKLAEGVQYLRNPAAAASKRIASMVGSDPETIAALR